MDQERDMPPSKRRKIERDNVIHHDSFVQNVDNSDVTVDNSVSLPVVDLTNDAWLHVFSYLGTADRLRLAGVCKRWKNLAQTSWMSITRLSFENAFRFPSKGVCSPSHQLTDDVLEVLLQKCRTRLRCLDLSSTPNHYLTPRALNLISQYATSLQELHLSRMTLNKAALKTLAERLPKLGCLNLQLCSIVNKGRLTTARMMLQLLKSLTIDGNDWFSGEFFSQAAQSLTAANTGGCWNLADKAVRFLIERRSINSETVHISLSCRLNKQSIAEPDENCTKQKSVKFSISTRGKVLASHILPLFDLSRLESLHLFGHTVTDELVHEVGRRCTLLRLISCRGCSELTDMAISHLSPCLHLESVNLSFCTYITDHGLIELSSAHSELKNVYLSRSDHITDVGVSHLLSTHPNMLELDISKCFQVTDGVLPMLALSLQRRQQAQPLKIWLWGTLIDRKKANVFGRRPDVTLA